MKQIFTCLLFLWAIGNATAVQAASPTVPASNFSFYQPEGSKLTFNFTNGNGARRIIVVKAGSPVTGLPVNGVVYTASQSFGNPGSIFTAADEYVVSDGASGNATVTNLQPGTTYHIAIFEYNGTGANTEYLTIAGTSSSSTVSAPTTATGAISFSTITGNSARIDFVRGNGARRLVVMRKGGAVDTDPADLVSYSESSYFGNGTEIGTGNFTMMSNTGNYVNVRNLEPDTDYHVSIYEFNGTGSPVYLKPPTRANFRTQAGPNTASTNISFNNIDGNRHGISFSAGNGSKRLVVARKGAAVSARPVNGLSYTANAAFGSGTEIAPDEFVVYNGTASSFTITNLESNTVYHYAIFDFDGAGSGTWYLTSSFLQGSTSTAVTPGTPASNISFTAITGSQATIRCDKGNGTYRLFVVKEGSPVDAVPAEYTNYPTSPTFGSGTSEMTPGNHAVANWGATSVNVTNLKTATVYHVAIYEYNGANYPVYLYPAATASFTTLVEPTEPVRSFSYSAIDGNAVNVSMTRGNGTHRLVIARKGAAVNARPVDGISYTANNDFGAGDEVLPDEFVVFNGTSNNVGISSLEHSSNYHLAAFEYNIGPDGLPDYLVSGFAASDFTTRTHPTVPASNITLSSVQNTQVTVQLTAGNGTNRLGVLREAAIAAADPVEYVSYITSTYGNGHQTGPGNYVVMKTSGSSSVISGLQPGTSYTLTVYEYNGTNGPVYLLPGTSHTFTTTGVQPLVVPTVSASDGVFTKTEGNSVTLTFTRGNGRRRLIALRKGAAVSFIPTENAVYPANNNFGTGTAVSPGEYIVFNDDKNTVDITGLEADSEYHVAIFEFNTDGTGYKYQSTGFYTTSFSTLPAPATGASGLQFTESDNGLTLDFTRGSGTGRLVAVREGAAITDRPADFSVYPANSRFGNGSQLGAGTFVVFAGNGASVTVTGLQPGRTYHVSVFEYNGTSGPVYNRTAVLSNTFTTTGTLPVSWGQVTASAGNDGVVVRWTTLQESNTAHFEVERSDDGVQYTRRTSIDAAVNSTTLRQYVFEDVDLPDGKYYYRIKQTDRDGNFSYSKIVSVHYSADRSNAQAAVYPNPATNQVSLTWPANVQQAHLLVTDVSGRQVMTRKVNRGELISIESLRPGIYYFRLMADNQTYVVKLVKR